MPRTCTAVIATCGVGLISKPALVVVGCAAIVVLIVHECWKD